MPVVLWGRSAVIATETRGARPSSLIALDAPRDAEGRAVCQLEHQPLGRVIIDAEQVALSKSAMSMVTSPT